MNFVSPSFVKNNSDSSTLMCSVTKSSCSFYVYPSCDNLLSDFEINTIDLKFAANIFLKKEWLTNIHVMPENNLQYGFCMGKIKRNISLQNVDVKLSQEKYERQLNMDAFANLH